MHYATIEPPRGCIAQWITAAPKHVFLRRFRKQIVYFPSSSGRKLIDEIGKGFGYGARLHKGARKGAPDRANE